MIEPASWYFDANTIGPAKVLSHVRRDVTWPGDDGQRGGSARNWLPACPIKDTATKDSEWIPTVTEAGMRIITRDHRIQTRLPFPDPSSPWSLGPLSANSTHGPDEFDQRFGSS